MIPFTQFKRPDGRRVDVSIERPHNIEELARILINDGHRFEIEHLMSGHVSMECIRGGVVMASELCPNGPEVPLAVDAMIQAAFKTSIPTPTEKL